MIRLENVTKTFRVLGETKTVLRNASVTFPSGVGVGLLGRNGAGKSTLLDMIAGTSDVTSGRIVTEGTISWPVGFAGSFHPDLTGAQNTRFIARVYGVDTDELCDFTEDFAELGADFHKPIGTYSSGMRSRLSFGVLMGIRFDTYLIDEVTSVGDASFRAKAQAVFMDRLRGAGAVVVSHSARFLRETCAAGIVLDQGRLTYFDQIDDAIAAHDANIGASSDAFDE